MFRKLRIFLFIPFLAAGALVSEAGSGETPVQPLFLADLPNPNDFSLFANGGWDGNWYVGYNTCWIQRIFVPEGKYRKAFIGAKLGRMKNYAPMGGAPWERKAFPGEIYMALSSTPSWNRKQSYFLTSTEYIPLEPNAENAVEGAGNAQWFWQEVPIKLLSVNADNYLALWSPTRSFLSVSSAPILAAGWGTKEPGSWLAGELKGLPPSDPAKALSTSITVFEPALAIKLIPADASEAGPKIKITKVADGKVRGRVPAPKVVWSSVEGDSVERAWVEISTDSKSWSRYGPNLWSAPYVFTLPSTDLPIGRDGKTLARVKAVDFLENTGTSDEVNLFEVKK